MEYGPFIDDKHDDLPIKNGGSSQFATLNNQMVPWYHIFPICSPFDLHGRGTFGQISADLQQALHELGDVQGAAAVGVDDLIEGLLGGDVMDIHSIQIKYHKGNKSYRYEYG